MNRKIKSFNKNRGFTIVELLVVIVVIGILAAITIVSYTGVTSRANKTAALSAADSVISKSEVYAVDSSTNLYPLNFAALSAATSDKSYYLSGVTFSGTTLASAPTPNSTVNFRRCGHRGTVAAPTTLNGAGTGILSVTGLQVGYWDYTKTSANLTWVDAGITSGAVGGYGVACFLTTTTTDALAAS